MEIPLYCEPPPPYTMDHSHWPSFTSEALPYSVPQGVPYSPGNSSNANEEFCSWGSLDHCEPYNSGFFYDIPCLVGGEHCGTGYKMITSIQHNSDYPGVAQYGLDTPSYGSMVPPAESFIPPIINDDGFYSEPMHPFGSFSSSIIDTVPPTLVQPAVLLPDQQSTYSELSANLAYLSSLSEPTAGMFCDENRHVSRQNNPEKARAVTEDKFHEGIVELADASTGALLSEVEWPRREKPTRKHLVASETKSSTKHVAPDTLRGRAPASKPKGVHSKRIPPPYGTGKASGTSLSAGKKLGLACLFCRERKIACGRPSESNPDQTCNQCARRLFKCEYPTESRRGQHKRSKNKLEVT